MAAPVNYTCKSFMELTLGRFEPYLQDARSSLLPTSDFLMMPGFTLIFFFEFVAPMIPYIERIFQLEQQNLNLSPIAPNRARLSSHQWLSTMRRT